VRVGKKIMAIALTTPPMKVLRPSDRRDAPEDSDIELRRLDERIEDLGVIPLGLDLFQALSGGFQ
jgi:hypothetical protein